MKDYNLILQFHQVARTEEGKEETINWLKELGY